MCASVWKPIRFTGFGSVTTETSLKPHSVIPVEKPDVASQSSNQPALVRLCKSTMRKFAECVAFQPVIELDPKVADKVISRLKKSNGPGLKRGNSVKDFDYYLGEINKALTKRNRSDVLKYCDKALSRQCDKEERAAVYFIKGAAYAYKNDVDIYTPDAVHNFVMSARLGYLEAIAFCRTWGISY